MYQLHVINIKKNIYIYIFINQTLICGKKKIETKKNDHDFNIKKKKRILI